MNGERLTDDELYTMLDYWRVEAKAWASYESLTPGSVAAKEAWVAQHTLAALEELRRLRAEPPRVLPMITRPDFYVDDLPEAEVPTKRTQCYLCRNSFDAKVLDLTDTMTIAFKLCPECAEKRMDQMKDDGV